MSIFLAKKIAKSPILARDRLGANTNNDTDSTDRDPWPHTGDPSSPDASTRARVRWSGGRDRMEVRRGERNQKAMIM